jgi:TolB-like protein
MAAIDKSARVCETCGSPIETTSSGDFGCMVCLFDAALDRDAEGGEVAFASAQDQFGAYTIEHRVDGSAWELGRGAMGVTYRAIDKVLDRPVALKLINTNLGSRSAEARERFMREARAAAALRHPNVATVYQFGVREETGQFFYAMELVEGETLEERVRRLGPLDVLSTVDIALQVTAALAAAEERGLVHRDLKPGNLMLVGATDGKEIGRARRDRTTQRSVPTVKVIDFGVAKAVAEKKNAMTLTHGGFVGTPAFASPEQFTYAPVDVRSDIYSLGATLWFLLTGHLLSSGRTVEEIREGRGSKPLPIEQLKAARVPRRFIALLTSMLAVEPAARPSGARELGTKLQKVRASITDRRKIVARFTVAAAILILGASAFFVFPSLRTGHKSASNPAVPEKSIAVLPFQNLSRDPDSAYFADGIQEEILTRLASIADLRVISRTSTQRYRSKPGNLPEIASQLGVANILEGSIQKTTDQVRVNVQLINAQTDSHLWADTYDRKLTDIFGVESEIAKRIADSLQAKLSGREQQALTSKPTNNPEAYDAYLRGLAFQGRIGQSTHLALKTIGCFERAVQLDANFAFAWARLSRTDAYLYFQRVDNTRRDAARDALEHAQKLQPNSPETLLALGYYQYWVLRDYGLAKATFRLVSNLLPGSSEVAWALSAVNRRDGNWNESLASAEQGLAVDPRNGELITTEAWTHALLRQFPTALQLYDQALDIIPNDPDVMSLVASIYQAQGNLEQAAKFLSEITVQTPFENAFIVEVTQLRLEQNHVEAVRLLQARLAQFQFTSELQKGITQVFLAFAQRLAGDTVGAKVTAEQARNTLEPLCKGQPDNSAFAAALSLAYAAVGEKDLALREAERATVLLPSAKDRVDGPGLEENLALVQAICGEHGRAISTLSRLLQTPFQSSLYGPMPLTAAHLRLDPLWDPLRNDPSFKKLVEDAEQQISPERLVKSAPDKSIAVLPFENLSHNPGDAYLAEGIQEQVLTRLVKIADLKVISRSSTQRYQSKPANLSEVASQLGVANILEGSVQKAGDQVRVSVRLLNAQTNSHV